MNDSACTNAMKWFREYVYFSNDYSDIPTQLLEYSEDKNMLRSISNYAKSADLGIQDMSFDFNSQEIKTESELPDDMPDDMKASLLQFWRQLSENTNVSDIHLKTKQLTSKAAHLGVDKEGNSKTYSLDLFEESDGTIRLMSIAPAIESVLEKGGVFFADELERELHPELVNFIVSKFQSKASNPHGAQIVFTTHNTELLNMELLRKDQLYFVDKSNDTGVSELYSLIEFNTRTTDNIRKGYLVGKYGATPDVKIEEVS